MRAAGCEVVVDMCSHAAMAAGIIKQVPRALAALRACKAYLKTHAVDLAVVIDSPTLNLPMAKFARRAGVPVLYYIAPQVWAWAEWRVRRVRARVDRLAVILPFEEAYFRGYGMDAQFVGHPLFDTLLHRGVNDEGVARIRSMGTPVVAILPGSRAHVVSEVFPGQVEVAQAIAGRHPGACFHVSVASGRVRPLIESRLAGAGIQYRLHENENGDLLTAADLALVASGTATLEVAYYHVPMLVMYNATRWGYHLVIRWLIKTKHLSLVNILAGRELVPEFMPYYRSTKPIADRALELLESPAALQSMRADIGAMIDPLVKTGAADNAAKIVIEMLARRQS
jgi:lipid-A-disaccharide synthase